MDGLFQAGRRRSRAVIAVLRMALLAGGQVASADQITVSTPFTLIDYETILVPGFDPALGTLIGVDVSVYSTLSNEIILLNLTRYPLMNVKVAVTENFGATGPGFEDGRSPSQSWVLGEIDYKSGVYYTLTSSLSEQINLRDYGGFYNGSGEVPFTVGYDTFVSTDSYVGAYDPHANVPSGEISITYTYLPPGFVPEPSGLALGGIALVVIAGWGCLAKPRRRADQTPTT